MGGIVVAVVACLFVAGCGSGSSSDAKDAEASTTNEVEASQADEVEASKPGEDEASKTFLKPKGKNRIASFGQEASAKEREAASKVLEENLRARESGDWAAQCATLTPGAIKDVSEVASIQGIDGGGCAKELAARAEPLQQTKGLRAYSMTGPIDALRFKGSRAYALYHGVRGQDYAMPMEKVDGEWKVDDLLEEEP